MFIKGQSSTSADKCQKVSKKGHLGAKIQQTKMLVKGRRFGDWFLFGLVWQYSSIQKNIIKRTMN